MKFRYQRWMIKTSLIYLFVGILLGVCRSNQNMPVLGGTKTITRDEIIDPEPNVKEIFFAQLILRQAPRPSDFSFGPYPGIGVGIQLENRSRSSYLGGLGYPDHHGCSPLDVSSEEGATWLDHRARGDAALRELQRWHSGSKRL
jgi:hypothetical protein